MAEFDRRELLKMAGIGGLVMGCGGVAMAKTRPQASTLRGAKVAAGNLAVDTPSSDAVVHQAPEAAQPEAGDPAPVGLIAPFAVGSSVLGATIVGMSRIVDGELSLSLRKGDGAEFRVDVCKRDDGRDAPWPLVRTTKYDLFLANGGHGDKRTNEKEGRTAYAIAAAIEHNEVTQPAVELRTMRERWSRG